MSRIFYHLTKEEREMIAEGIAEGIALKEIALSIGKDPTAISREVKAYRQCEGRVHSGTKTNICERRRGCKVRRLCRPNCPKPLCRSCQTRHCADVCDDFAEEVCARTRRWPHVCGGCGNKRGCPLLRYSYHPAIAHAAATRVKSQSRCAIATGKAELARIDAILANQLKANKQSLEVIAANPANRIAVSGSTLRRYVEGGRTRAIRMDLLSAPARKVRKKRAKPASRHTGDGRGYRDFEALDEDVRAGCWEMDTVFGTRAERCCLLTLHHRQSLFTLIFKIPACTLECVTGILDYLEILCSETERAFEGVFGVILTDNGAEFCDAGRLETSHLGRGRRCRLYYCDPYSSWQKGSIEGRHALIRRVVPKGSPIGRLTHADIALVASHVNSYPAMARDGRTPYDMAVQTVAAKILDELGIVRIDADKVCLTRDLLDC
jgi:IS30 family transposase